MVSPVINRLIPAEILTSSQYIFGQIKVIQSGLLGMLTDTTNSVLEINDASIASIQHPSRVTNYAAQLYMVRAQLAAVCLGKREYMGSLGVMRGGYQRLMPYTVQISTPVYDISGTIEWSGRFEFSALITEGTSNFIIVSDATLTAQQFPELKIESPAILVNRSFLQSLIITKRPPAIAPTAE